MQVNTPVGDADRPRVAIAHDYLTQRGGAEKVVLSMSRAFPEAPIYTLLYDRDNTYPEFADRDVRVSSLNKFAPFRRNHRAALPVLPLAAQATFIDADVVLTSTSGWAHGFRTNGRKLVHCHSPARWLYLPEAYLGADAGMVKRAVLGALTPALRAWDRRAARSCHSYLAISTVVQQRIVDAYGIDAPILPPPVAMSPKDRLEPVEQVQQWLDARPADPSSHDGSFYLCVARLLPYKNVDAVVGAFIGSNHRLVVVGRGPEAERIRAMKPANVQMLSDLTDAEMAWLYRHCRATIAASYEDYGLTPIESGVWGKPTLALRWGGFLDTICEGVTGLYFDSPDPASIAAAIDRFEASVFDADTIRQHVLQFSEERYAESMHAAVGKLASAPGLVRS